VRPAVNQENVEPPETMVRSLSPTEHVTADRFQLSVKDELLPPFPPRKVADDARTRCPDRPTLMVWFVRALRWTLASLTLWGANELAGAILALWVFHFAVNVPIDEYGLVQRVVAQLVPVLATSAPFGWPVIVIGGGRAGELHLLRAKFRCTVSSPLLVPRARKWGLNVAGPVTCVHVIVELATEMTGGLAKTGCSMTSGPPRQVDNQTLNAGR
jgi:hypothetical protein